MRTLAQSRAANVQAIARLAEKDLRLRRKEEAALNRRLFEVGGLVMRAGLLELPTPALLGMLLADKEEASRPNVVARWTEAGAAALAPADERKEVAIAEFLGVKLTREIAAALQEVGLRENRVLGLWQGRVDYENAEKVVRAHGGTIRRRAPPEAEIREAAE